MTDILSSTAAQDMCEAFDAALPTLPSNVTALVAKTDDELGWMPLPLHMADAACVGCILWDSWLSQRMRNRITELMGLTEEQARVVLAFLCGVHDVGKATRGFAERLTHREMGRQAVEGIAGAGYPLGSRTVESDNQVPHAAASQAILKWWLHEAGYSKRTAQALASVVGAHHGVAVDSEKAELADFVVRRHEVQWHEAHNKLVEFVAAATGFNTVVDKGLGGLYAPVLQLLTGVVVMSDWIASNASVFPYSKSDAMAHRVAAGLSQIDLTPPWEVRDIRVSDPDAFYRTTFGWGADKSARPIQRAILMLLASASGPMLVVIEAPTGEGKTEAAEAFAQLLVCRQKEQGVMFAAPTMATSDGLFDRIADWARSNTTRGEITSMSLVHSKAALSRSFEKLRFRGISDTDGGVIASQWLAGPKKAMLSNLVVGTVDQVLMLALQSKHSMLRHLGLAGKVVIVDEVHSYDLYMSSYLEVALQWLAHYGASVVLLSATLPIEQKQRLVDAYAGEYMESPPVLRKGYPLVTAVSAEGVNEISVPLGETDLDACVACVDDSDSATVTLIAELLADGGIALVICNAVARAQSLFAGVRAVFPSECELHHSAFIASDRVEKEARLREELGPQAHRGGRRPWRKVIVATQVAEQSLDIDADVLLTDIAPMDLMIQRIGRLQRHYRPLDDRPARLREPQIYVRGIIQQSERPSFDSGAIAVYGEWILLKTYAVLPTRFRRPDDIDRLVAATYDNSGPVPAAWQEAHTQWLQTRAEAAQRAQAFQIPSALSAWKLSHLFARYSRTLDDSTAGEQAGYAQVRDTEPTIEVIPIVGTAECYRPLGATNPRQEEWIMGDPELDNRTARMLAHGTLRLPPRLYRSSTAFNELLDWLEKATPLAWNRHFLLKGMLALPVDNDGHVTVGSTTLRYSNEFGLEQVSADMSASNRKEDSK